MHNIIYFLHFLSAIAGVAGIFWLSRRCALPAVLVSGQELRKLWPVFGCVALVCLGFEYLSFKFSSPPAWFWDFMNAYYPAGRAIAHDDAATFHELIAKGAEGGFVNIPVVAYLLAPFGFLPRTMAAILFTLIGLGLTVLAWLQLVRLARLEPREQWILAFLFLVNGPLVSGIKWGNLSYFILPALVGGLVLVRAGRSAGAGALLGLAAVIKPPLILLGLFFLLRRDWRGALGFAAVGIGTVLLSLALFGWNDNLLWFQTSIVQYSQGWLPTFSVQSINGFILRFDADARISEWIPQLPTPLQKGIGQLITGLIFLIAAAACFKLPNRVSVQPEPDADERRDLQYLLVCCLCLVSSPLAWSHYYAWLLMPAAFFLGSQSPVFASPWPRRIGWIAIALVTPLNGWPWLISNPVLLAAYRSLFMSHLLFGGVLWFGLIAWWLASTGGLLVQFNAWKYRRADVAPREVTIQSKH